MRNQLFFLLGLFVFCCFLPSAYAQSVAVLVPAQLRPYLEVVDGIKQFVSKPTVFFLNKNRSYVTYRLQKQEWDVVIALGSKSVALLKQIKVKAKFLFYSLVVYPEEVKEADFMCGVYLAVPPKTILQVISSKFPQLKTILIPVSSQESKNYALQIQKLAPVFKVKILVLELEKKGLLDPLEHFWPVFDGLLFVPDPIFSSTEIASFMLNKAILHKKAVIGYNKFFLENGALFCFIPDFKQTGEKTGRLIQTALHNKECTSVPASYELKVNANVLKYLNQPKQD